MKTHLECCKEASIIFEQGRVNLVYHAAVLLLLLSVLSCMTSGVKPEEAGSSLTLAS